MNIYDELELAYGNHFEDLFSKLMKQKYGLRYQIISTSGNIGDMKVDGVLDCNIAFAVYAPEVYREQNVIQKLRTDFNGFMEHKRNGEWSSINQYCFVVKRERQGITPLVANQIFAFNKDFPVAVMTMEDLKKIADGYLTFSADGYLLEEFKVDVTDIMEYIRDTDFSAEPFDIFLEDRIVAILEKWNKKKYIFRRKNTENLKKEILKTLAELCQYLSPVYMHCIENERLMFNSDSIEAHKRLTEILAPQTYHIRCNVGELLEMLYNIEESSI